MATRTGDFVWYELMTTDASAACRFYGDVVGWRSTNSGMPEVDYRIVHAGEVPIGGVLQLTDEMLSGGARPAWVGYVEIEDVDATATRLEAAGGSTLMPPRDMPDVGRIAMIADADGVPIYLIHGANRDLTAGFSPREVGYCAWNELQSSDPEAAIARYSGEFGWKRGETMPMGELGNYQMIDANEQTIGAIMPTPPGSSPMWRFYFRVADLRAAAVTTERGGGAIVDGPHEVPGNDEIVVATDPQGALFALVAARA